MTSTRKQLITGIAYTAISKYAGIIISLVIAGILARLLTPEDFGVVAIATVIITFFSIFSDLGISPAIVQNKTLDQKDLNEIFSFTIWFGLLLAGIFFVCSGFIASYFNSPILINICRLLSVNLFFATINIVPNALLYKDKRFAFIAWRSLSVQSGTGIIAVIAAFSGAGLYALLINPILSSIALFIINFKAYPQKIRKTWGLQSIQKIFSFSLYQLLFNIINYFSRNLDKFLIGKYMNMTSLGYYEKSYRLMMLPLQNITHVITPVMHPVFSEFQHDLAKLSASYLKVVRFLAFIGFPLSVFLYFSAREITLIIFGSQWTESIPVFQILTLSVGIQIILSTSGSIFQAANSTKIMFICGVISSLLNVAGMLIGIFVYGTLEAVAWSICITFTLNFILCYILMYRVTFHLGMIPFWRQFISPFILTLINIFVFYTLNGWFTSFGLLAELLIKGCIFVLIFFLYIQGSHEYDIIGKIRSVLKKRKQ